MTVYFSDISIGQSASLARTVSEEDVQLFGKSTGDMNPVHFDEVYARKTVFRGRVAHGALSIGFISAAIGMELPGPGTIFLSVSARFLAPVRIGDTVVTTCTVRALGEGRQVTFDCICKVGDKNVVEGEALVIAPKTPPLKTEVKS